MLKRILNYSFNITHKQAVLLIFITACFLNIITFIILRHNGFYSYLNEDVACIVDMTKSFETEYDLLNDLNKHDWHGAINLLKTYWKPPVFFVFSAPVLSIINNANLFLPVLNFLLCFITLLAVYGTVKNTYSIKAGLFASFILSLCPLFFVMHRTFFIETLLTTSICIILYIITKNKFDNIYWNVLFTLALTFALLTKEQIFIYYPVFLLFISANKENYTNVKRIINIISAFIFSYLIAYFLWYKYGAPNIFQHLLKFASEKINADFFYYLKSFFFIDISPLIFVLFVISVIFFILKRKHSGIITSFLFVLFIFSLSENKVSRHIFPLLIFCPILISLFVFQIKNVFIKRTLVITILCVLSIQFIAINFFNLKIFTSGNFYKYNYFKGITYYNYKPGTDTYKKQYEYFKDLLGQDFEKNTAFIQFFQPQTYNFLIKQENTDNRKCDIFTYYDIDEKTLIKYKNVVISTNDEQEYNNFANMLLKNDFEFVCVVDINNHTDAKTFLYKKK